MNAVFSFKPVAQKDVSAEEWQARVDLAACYRLAHMNRMSKVIWNHITARIPGPQDHILINRFGLRYDEITASNLIKIDLEGNVLDGEDPRFLNRSGYVIHAAVHKARPDVTCVMHTHSRGGQGVAALKCGLLPLSQEAMMFYEDVGYHGFEGIANDEDEMDRLARDLGDKNQLILANHGLLTAGATVGETYWRMFHLELACGLQMDVLAAGQDYVLPPREICEKTREQYKKGRPGLHEWPALLRMLDQSCPEYKS
ncbi:MAG: class II aldolase/adducin family protein [Mesorhizobium sp.]|nr:class II aldolase/adducin family protein [Mesorhizobium sp.]